MAELRYGHVEGPGKGREYPMAADQYIARRGGKFVYLSGGEVTLCASGTGYPIGWVESSKDDSGYNCWRSVSGDTGFVIYDSNAVFEMPVNESAASLAASQIGLAFKLVESNATYTYIQKALVGNTSVAGGVRVVDVDTDNKTVRVKLHPDYVQD